MIQPLATIHVLPSAPRAERAPSVATLAAVDGPLLQEEGVLLTKERLVARGHTHVLSEVLGADTERSSPRVWPMLVLMAVVSVIVLPVLWGLSVSTSASRGHFEVALIGAAVCFFGSMARLLLVEDTYWLVLHTRDGDRRVLSGQEPQRMGRLARMVHEAAAVAQRGH